MRRSLGTGAIAVVSLALALLLLVLSVTPSGDDQDPSSRAAGRAGTLALHDWLARLGFAPHRISGHFTTAGSDVILIVDPTMPVSAAESATLAGFVQEGGDLVLAISPARARLAGPLLAALRLDLSGADVAAGDSTPAQPFDAGDRVHHVPMAVAAGIAPATTAATPLLASGRDATAVVERVGRGRAYVLASPFPLSNDGLRDGDSAPLVLSLLERARGGRLALDEYHHGEQDASAAGAGAIFGSPVGLALLLAALAVVAYLVLSGRRLGRPLPASDAGPIPSTAGYVAAVAGLFARSHHRGAVAQRYADELKQRVGMLAGVDPALDDDRFSAALAAAGSDLHVTVREVLAQARRLAAGTPDPAQLLALAREVDRLEAAYAAPAPAVPAAQ